MTTYRLFDGVAGRPGVGSSGTQPPSSSAGGSNNQWLAGQSFILTSGGLWLDGYWWWVADSSQPVTGVKFALWDVTSNTAGIFITGSEVTAGTLTVGQMNFIPLATPIQLSLGVGYCAAVGYGGNGNFPFTENQFGSGQPYASGIVNGPLTGYPGTGPHSLTNGAFSQSLGTDPSAALPDSALNNSNFWVDVQIDTSPPAGYAGSYRIWPNQPNPDNWQLDTPQANWTLATEFTIAVPFTLNKIWFYSPSGSTQLPTWAGLWNVSTQATVASTVNTSPTWSGAAGSGWVSTSYAGVTVPAGDYKVTVFNGGSITNPWSATTFPFWGTNSSSISGVAVSGITSGPITAPGDSTATSPGQSTYNQNTSPTYPLTFVPLIGGATYWVDVELTPQAAAPTTVNLTDQQSGSGGDVTAWSWERHRPPRVEYQWKLPRRTA